MTYIMLEDSLVESLHDIVIEPHQLQGCDQNKLESCLYHLSNKIHDEGVEDIHEAAAVIVESVAMSHSFADGNKRTALLSMVAFYIANQGNPPDFFDTNVAQKIEALAGRKLLVVELASWLRQLPKLTKKKLKRISQAQKPNKNKNKGPVANSRKGKTSRW